MSDLRLEIVDMMPLRFEPGILYHSPRYELAIHLCGCGCGHKTVTPLGNNGWTLTNGPTLRPSIGNQQMPCRSHYYVTNGKIEML